jgi:hypothetical protein
MRSQIRRLFAEFAENDRADETVACFTALTRALEFVEGQWTFDDLRSAVEPALPFTQRKIFRLLAERRARVSHLRQEDRPPLVVAGAGPVGLRSAIEAILLGFPTTIVERRTQVSRHNIIKTWQHTVDDFVSLGAQVFFPGLRAHDVPHLATRVIQLVLLKAALLLGVRMTFGECVVGVSPPGASMSRGDVWHAAVLPAAEAKAYWASTRGEDAVSLADPYSDDHAGVRPSSFRPTSQSSKVDFYEAAESQDGAIHVDPAATLPQSRLVPFATMIDATGESSRLVRTLGFDRRLVRMGTAIGLVVNARFAGVKGEVGIREARWYGASGQLGQGPLGLLASEGIMLENIEYMRDPHATTHFVVATVTKKTLQEQGLFRDVSLPTTRQLVAGDNVDPDALRRLARRLLVAVGVPADAPFAQHNPVHLFDFSTRGHLTTYGRVLRPPGNDEGPSALFIPAGDALHNPFWPQGLGVNAGIHTGLNAVWAAHCADASDDADAALDELSMGHTAVYWSATRNLTVPAISWTADPATRMQRFIFKDIATTDANGDRHRRRVTDRAQDLLQLPTRRMQQCMQVS